MTASKIVLSAASGVGGAGLDVDEVFKNHLWVGTGSSFSINNGIDLSNEGGLVWIKNRGPNAANHAWYDTARGVRNYLMSNMMADQNTASSGSGLTAFNSNGFNIGSGWVDENNNGQGVASWTFRKAPNFFDLMTWTGNGAANRAISHNLGSVPGMIIVKRYAGGSENWAVWHREIHNNSSTVIYLDQNGAKTTSNSVFSQTNPTSTNFYVGNHPLSNNNGDSYVAWVFAHNNNDGGFGPDADQDIIKCGLYYGNGSTNGPNVNLGFEPQWLMVKRANGAGDWQLHDSMRGQGTDLTYPNMTANSSSQEITDSNRLDFTPTGFKIVSTNNSYNGNGSEYIYMAIRRGSLKTPETVSEVFAIDTANSTGDGKTPIYRSTFPVDLTFVIDTDGNSSLPYFSARLATQRYLTTSTRGTEQSATSFTHDFNNGFRTDTSFNADTTRYAYMWRRAPKFFDVTTWKVDATGNQTINHNLGVIPEFIISKNRDSSGNGDGSWWIAHKDLTGWDSANENDRHTFQDFNTNASAQQGYHKNFTSTQINMLSNGAGGFTTGQDVIAYLFATLSGISKVGSYTGTGSAQNIDCGFSNGAKFVLLKAATGSGPWILIDSARGISTGGYDPQIEINGTSAQSASANNFNAHSAGFGIATGNPDINSSGTKYIFYAIAT